MDGLEGSNTGMVLLLGSFQHPVSAVLTWAWLTDDLPIWCPCGTSLHACGDGRIHFKALQNLTHVRLPLTDTCGQLCSRRAYAGVTQDPHAVHAFSTL